MRTASERAAGYCDCCRNCTSESMCSWCQRLADEIQEAMDDQKERCARIVESLRSLPEIVSVDVLRTCAAALIRDGAPAKYDGIEECVRALDRLADRFSDLREEEQVKGNHQMATIYAIQATTIRRECVEAVRSLQEKTETKSE